MEFLYQIVSALSEPFPVVVVLLGVAVTRLWWRGGYSHVRLLVTIIYAVLLAICTPALAYLVTVPLERQYPQNAAASDDIGTIVVLGGYVRPVPDDLHYDAGLLGEDTLFRCLKAYELYKLDTTRRIVLSGGKVNWSLPGPTISEAMQSFFHDHGLDEASITAEQRSSTTYENAKETADILRESGTDEIILITSASHMTRARKCFEALGVRVQPIACDYRTSYFFWSASAFLPSPFAAAQFQRAVHEWLGFVWYYLHGHFSPAPLI